MWIKEYSNQYIITVLEFSNFTKKKVLKIFGKVKFIKAPARFKLMIYRFVVNVLTHCSTLLGINYVKEKIYKIIFDFMVISIGSTS